MKKVIAHSTNQDSYLRSASNKAETRLVAIGTYSFALSSLLFLRICPTASPEINLYLFIQMQISVKEHD